MKRDARLRKSVRRYLREVAALPPLKPGQPCPKATLDYLRALYAEYTEPAVRAEIERQRK